MEDQQNVGSSWDKENHSSNQNNNDGSRSGNHDKRKARRLDNWRIALQKQLATMSSAVVNARRTLLKQAERIGKVLCRIKASLGHRNWQQWLAENTTIDGVQLISDKVARNWMAIARNSELLRTELNVDLNIIDALRLISQNRALAKPRRDDGADQNGPEIDTTADAVALDQTLAPELPAQGKLISELAIQTANDKKKHTQAMLRSAFNIYKHHLEHSPDLFRRIIVSQLTQLMNLATSSAAANGAGGTP